MTASDLDRFRRIIADRLGLQYEDGKLDFLADLLRRRLAASGRTAASYIEALGSNAREEFRVLAAGLTVPETYFLRNADQFRALAELALPERIRAQGARRRLRLLSAGCASGEEAYSMAITLRDHFPAIGQQEVEILAVDVNPAIIEKAVPAVYSAWSLRETPALVRQRHFRADGNDFVLDESVRAMVTFEERNLVEEDATFWRTDRFDVIFCRNVIMYLVPGLIQRVVERLVQSLVPGGFLFLGHAETLRGLSQEVHLRRTHGTFYYQKRKPSEAQPAALEAPQGAAWPLPRVFHSYESWVDVIQSASERIGNLVRDCRQPGAETVQPPADGRPRYAQAELGAALELLRQERFREALDVLPAAADVDTQLLRAVLLANCGDIPAVEAVCDQIRRSDDLNASAHYLTALCREHAGDLRGASEHDRVAVYLDPEFAMPHLHLGLLAKRMGDVHAARNELQQAENLLLREDASRILLLGGGFSREALLKFSRAALDACGAAS